MGGKFTFPSIKVYYDTVKGVALKGKPTIKDKNVICFPSMGEYTLFKRVRDALKSSYYELVIHPKISRGGISWVIDLGIRTVDVRCQSKLADLANTCNGSRLIRCHEIYLEFKGIQDKNFLYKLKNLQRNSNTAYNSLIIIGRSSDEVLLSTGVKPILSIERFLRVLDITLLGCDSIQ